MDFEDARQQYGSTVLRMCKRFSNRLDDATLMACADRAILRCIQTYDAGHGQAITSSLYRFARWECLTAIEQGKQRWESLGNTPVYAAEDNPEAREMAEDYLSLLEPHLQRIVRAYYIHGHTIREIATLEGKPKSQIHMWLKKSLKMMRMNGV